MKRALVIAHEPDGVARQVEYRLRERGIAVQTHVVTELADQPNQASPWPDFAQYDLIAPMGSVRSLADKDPIDSWIYDELALLRAAHERGQPVIGICFGGQLMAEALGGSVEKAPVTEIGWYEIESGPSGDNPAGPGPWMEWHHDRFTPPPGAEILAVNDNAIQLFRLGRTVGTQFHPEVDTDHLTEWLSACEDSYLHEHGVTREQVLTDMAVHQERNTKQCHAFVDWYLDTVAFPELVTR